MSWCRAAAAPGRGPRPPSQRTIYPKPECFRQETSREICAMEELLEAYVTRIGPMCAGLDEKTGHLMASMLTAYTMGLAERVESRADEVSERLEKKPDLPAVIGRAVLVIRENAQAGPAAPVRSEYTFAGDVVGEQAPKGAESEVILRFEAEDADYFAIQLHLKRSRCRTPSSATTPCSCSSRLPTLHPPWTSSRLRSIWSACSYEDGKYTRKSSNSQAFCPPAPGHTAVKAEGKRSMRDNNLFRTPIHCVRSGGRKTTHVQRPRLLPRQGP